jgi:holo-[acyl-carrier protein] synthase
MDSQLFALGTDLVSVPRMAASVSFFGDRFVQRVFTRDEIAYSQAAAPQLAAQRLAGRFAAKEAAIKVLRPGGIGLDWRAIEVVLDPGDGACLLNLRGTAAALAQTRGVTSLALSLSHESEYAIATVVASLPSRSGREGLAPLSRPALPFISAPINSEVRRGLSLMTEIIRAIIRDHARLSRDVSTLDAESDLYQAGMSSHASVNLMLALEAAFDVEFPERMLNRRAFQSIAAICASIEELKAGAVNAR